ncbi:hypothetical protein M514_17091 [Trichuris suis]|uniref:Uncharacterized protein n=1 Tax=Trichuris suis TaxID=68888 RepID=A0A085NMC3_9BILA|nr:hypothetical protein M514_17091 [Trichuris suis]
MQALRLRLGLGMDRTGCLANLQYDSGAAEGQYPAELLPDQTSLGLKCQIYAVRPKAMVTKIMLAMSDGIEKLRRDASLTQQHIGNGTKPELMDRRI